MNEFEVLFDVLRDSGCAKKQTAAGTYVNGKFCWAVNRCVFDGEQCPRLNMPSGQGYELCRAEHAEANLAAMLTRWRIQCDGIVWLVGHYWACEPCASALKTIGMVELRIRENR